MSRHREVQCHRAAHAAGLAPELVHAEAGALVLRFIEGRTLTPADVRAEAMLRRLVALLHRCHREIPRHLRGPAPFFWVYHAIRDYAARLAAADSPYRSLVPELSRIAEALETATGPIDVVFAHNDLLAANIIDDGKRLWLIDWEYAGYNSPLFDLGGLATNNEFTSRERDRLLEAYFDKPLQPGLARSAAAMRCASLLREAMWSMVSELHSTLAFDYALYTKQNLERFDAAWREFDGG
ncbi:MAG: phosphotransferase [Proteobacteria bacterium]|nr:phosphotransferase [Pseudomonadota bacterium]